jgi:hypothetical protein
MPAIAARLPDPLAKILYIGFWEGPIGPLTVLYAIVPWIGVMAAGYAFGRVLLLDGPRRDRACLAIGLGATALFLVLRGFNLYGDPRPWTSEPPMPAAFSFLNTAKYPASLSFLLMTLGPTIAIIPLLERARGAAVVALAVFGRVPFFFYLLHIPLIHALALVVSWIRLGEISPWLFANHPMGNPEPPPGYVWPLPLLYFVWAVVVAMLYAPCRWFARRKAAGGPWWLRYI